MGSLYGGTLVTIKGENFSNEPLDNPVKIGSHYCYVITSTPSEITCRTDYLLDQESGDQLLLVFLKTSEEAASEQSILFNFVAPKAEVLDIRAEFDTTTLSYQVFVDGTLLDESVQLVIDGLEQELVSVTEN